MPSMDIVSKPPLHEVANALEQATKELKNRWDFKDTGAEITEIEGGYKLEANTEEKVKQVADVLEDKFVKRKLSIKYLERKDPTPSGARYTMTVLLKKSLDTENAKKVVALIKEQPDETIWAIVKNWPTRFDAKRGRDLGFEAERNFEEIIRAHIADELGGKVA